MSWWRTPRTTSNGASCTVVGSNDFTSGTAVTRPVSARPHVSVRVKCSPTCTAFVSVFHQHVMASSATSSTPWDGGAGGAIAGVWVVAAGANQTPDVTTIAIVPIRPSQNLLITAASIVLLPVERNRVRYMAGESALGLPLWRGRLE